MITNKDKKLFIQLKKKSIDAYSLGMLPYVLSRKIINLDVESCSVEDVKFYSYLTEMYMRVKGFYKKYPLENHRVEIEINLLLKEKGVN